MTQSTWGTAVDLLRAASRLIDGIQDGLAERGFDDVRPVHGFAFARLGGNDATAADLAEYLGITKQAAGQLVDHLVDRGYVTREADPRDGRARLLVLTARGRACTTAAEQAAAATVGNWMDQVPPEHLAGLQASLHLIAGPGRLRPTW